MCDYCGTRNGRRHFMSESGDTGKWVENICCQCTWSKSQDPKRCLCYIDPNTHKE